MITVISAYEPFLLFRAACPKQQTSLTARKVYLCLTLLTSRGLSTLKFCLHAWAAPASSTRGAARAFTEPGADRSVPSQHRGASDNGLGKEMSNAGRGVADWKGRGPSPPFQADPWGPGRSMENLQLGRNWGRWVGLTPNLNIYFNYQLVKKKKKK